MKTSVLMLLAVLLPAGLSFGGVPTKAPDSKYSTLWSNSPFTSKPPPPKPTDNPSLLADWTLGGVSAVEGGYMITLQHKKNAGEYQIIRPRGVQMVKADEVKWVEHGAPGTFKLDRVERGEGGWKGIKVHLLAGGKPGIVRFDDKNLVPKAAAAAPQGNRQGQGQRGQAPGAQPVPGQTTPPPGVRQPRQRVLPPAPAQR